MIDYGILVLSMKIINLCAGYGKNLVINNFSMDVLPGDRIIVAGPNGCGKSTLLKSIIGIVKPFSGKIILEPEETIAYCKQDYPDKEFPITVSEIVAMGTKSSRESVVDEALIKAGCLELKNRLFYSLSGGEKQKVSLARCYCQNAKLLLLDEPSSFLDSQSKEAFIEQMKKLEKEPFAIIAVTHDEEILKSLNWRIVRGETFIQKKEEAENGTIA